MAKRLISNGNSLLIEGKRKARRSKLAKWLRPKEPKRLGFLDLPAEIRQKILRYVLQPAGQTAIFLSLLQCDRYNHSCSALVPCWMIKPRPTLSLQRIHCQALELTTIHSLIYTDMDFVFRAVVKDAYKEFFSIKILGDEIAKLPAWRYHDSLMRERVSHTLIASYTMRGLLRSGLTPDESVDVMIQRFWKIPLTYEGAKRVWINGFVSFCTPC